jgi:hypothetical protein
MDPLFENQLLQTRRQFFGHTGLRFGGLALAWLLGERTVARAAQVHPSLPGFPHFPPRAKRVIYLHMNGGPRSTICGITSRTSRPTSTRICQSRSATANA